MVGKAKADAIISGGIHLLSAGSSDFVQNYYINPLLRGAYTPDQFSENLMTYYTNFVKVLQSYNSNFMQSYNLNFMQSSLHLSFDLQSILRSIREHLTVAYLNVDYREKLVQNDHVV